MFEDARPQPKTKKQASIPTPLVCPFMNWLHLSLSWMAKIINLPCKAKLNTTVIS